MRYAMIMAGGAGTRLWPMSRRGKPKQLLRFIEQPGQTFPSALLETSAQRLEGLMQGFGGPGPSRDPERNSQEQGAEPA